MYIRPCPSSNLKIWPTATGDELYSAASIGGNVSPFSKPLRLNCAPVFIPSQVPTCQRCLTLMSNRALSNKHALPQNPTWIEFERTDGDQTQWPPNTTRIVDREGHVNYMRIASIDEPLSIKWRVEVGKALAALLNKPGRLQG